MPYRFINSDRFDSLDLSEQSIIGTPLDTSNMTTSMDFARYFLRQTYISLGTDQERTAKGHITCFFNDYLDKGEESSDNMAYTIGSLLGVVNGQHLPDRERYILRLLSDNHIVNKIISVDKYTGDIFKRHTPDVIYDTHGVLFADSLFFRKGEREKNDWNFQCKPEYQREFLGGCLLALWRYNEFSEQPYVSKLKTQS